MAIKPTALRRLVDSKLLHNRFVLCLLGALALAADPPALPLKAASANAEVKFGVPIKPGPMDSLLLKDCTPASSLVVPEHRILRARFPAIDAHSHSSMNRMRTPADVAAWVRRMDDVGVERSVVFTEATGAEFDRQVEL